MLMGPGLSLVAAFVALVAACLGGVSVRGTTAVPAAGWAAAAAAAFALESAARLGGGLVDPAARACVRLVVVALSLCPIMSLLGAKRPQHGVWQFIVGSLAGVLALPAASAALVRPGSPPDIHPLQRWFMVAVAAVAAMNFAATRHGLAASLVVVGQGLLMRELLPFVETRGDASEMLDAVAGCLVALGAVVAAAQSTWWPARSSRGVADPTGAIDDPFLALRETLGAAWSLRIAERFNALAEIRGWPCRLRFDGLHVGGDPDDVEWRADAVRTARALFRRFASDDWVARHGAEGEKA